MKSMIWLLLGLWLAGVITSLPAVEIYVVNSESRTLSRIDSETGVVNNSFALLGLTPNLMELDEDFLYVVCSGDNAVQMLDRSTGAHLRFIPVAASCNPWDVVKAGGYLYVSGLFTNRVYKISLDSFAVVGSLEVGTAPEGLCHYDGKLYVANTGGYQNNYANSSVSVIDLAYFTVTETIAVGTNPQYLMATGGFLHVSCTGNWLDIPGRVDIIDLGTVENIQQIALGGHPNSLWRAPSGIVYVGDGMNTALYSYDAVSYQIYHGAANPLSPAAYAVNGNNDLIALLSSNWGSNSVVYLRHPDLSAWTEYTVGLVGTDIKVAAFNPVGNDDQMQSAALRVYPNPLPAGEVLSLDKVGEGQVEFALYNLRGQKLQHAILAGNERSLRLEQLPAGVYLYRVRCGGSSFQGRLLIK